jgi:glutathione-regulated potassium-efflux system protein KefB
MVLMAQGGEFAFVLYAAAQQAGIIDGTVNAVMTAVVICSMALTPLAVGALKWLVPATTASTDRVERPDGLSGSVLMIGFGRFGQVASQSLLARAWTSPSSTPGRRDDPDRRALRLQGLLRRRHAAGRAACLGRRHGDGHRGVRGRQGGFAEDRRAGPARVPAGEAAGTVLRPRACAALLASGVDYQIRETFESASAFGEAALRCVGAEPDDAAAVAADVRRRDQERLELQATGGMLAGVELMHSNRMKPEPLSPPTRAGVPLSEETAAVTSAKP